MCSRSACLASLVVALSCVMARADQRPNILFIMSDDHCARAVGAYGLRLAGLDPTPNLDRLARNGMLFENVFCTNSICTPSRASVITGQYSHRNGVYDLYSALPGEKNYLPKEMQKAGYTTAVVGKWHLKDSPKFFDYYSVIAGRGSYMNPVMHTNVGGTKRLVRFDSTLQREIEVVDTQGHSSDVLTDISLDWLHKGRDKTKPFFLMHHFKAPHDMFTIVSFLHRTEIGPCSNPKTIAIAGWHGTGPVVSAAGALVGEAIDRAAIDTEGFRFGQLLDYRDPMFLPGGAKCLDLRGLIAQHASRPLWLAGEGQEPAVITAAYRAASAADGLVTFTGEAALQESTASQWLLE